MRSMSARLLTVLLALALVLPSGAASGVTEDNTEEDASETEWQLKYVETFSAPINDDVPWVLDDYSDPVDDRFDDNGDRWRLQWGPDFDAALATFDTYRKDVTFGHDGWLTAALSARDSGGRLDDDSFTNPEDRPSITNDTIEHAGRVGLIDVPKHTGGALIRNTEPLPQYYRIEVDLKTLDFGGERDGSVEYDGKYNGYGTEGCKTFFPWPDRGPAQQPITPDDPCTIDNVREGSSQSYNAFHMLGIYDFPAMPRNLTMVHWHRKLLIDMFAPAPSRTVGGYEVCNSETGEYYPWVESNRTTVNALFFNGPQGQFQTFVNSCDEYPRRGAPKSVAEFLRDDMMPLHDYKFAVERTEAGYTIEVSGNFRHVGEQTYRFHRGFIDTDRTGGSDANPTLTSNVPIFNYNVVPEEYDGEFNNSHTISGVGGSRTWTDLWPEGSAFPDYFVVGDPYTNAGEGNAHVDNIRLYVPRSTQGELELEVVSSARCVAGNVYVTVTARNDNDLPVDVEFQGEFGSRSFVGVAPDRFASHAFNTRSGSVDGEFLTVHASALVDGVEVTVGEAVDFQELSCG